jgi:hypothetical protein
MPRHSRSARRKQATRTIERTGTAQFDVKSPSIPTAAPAVGAKSSTIKPVTYDPSKYIGYELRRSLIVAGLVMVLMVISYFIFR